MKVKRKTKIQQGDNILKTTIPLTVCEVLEFEKGDSLMWSIENGKAIIQKENKDDVLGKEKAY